MSNNQLNQAISVNSSAKTSTQANVQQLLPYSYQTQYPNDQSNQLFNNVSMPQTFQYMVNQNNQIVINGYNSNQTSYYTSTQQLNSYQTQQYNYNQNVLGYQQQQLDYINNVQNRIDDSFQAIQPVQPWSTNQSFFDNKTTVFVPQSKVSTAQPQTSQLQTAYAANNQPVQQQRRLPMSTISVNVPNMASQQVLPSTSVVIKQEVTNPSTSSPPTNTTLSLPLVSKLEMKLNKIFKSKTFDNQRIFTEIENKANTIERSCKEFIHALFRSLFNSCLSIIPLFIHKFNYTLFQSRLPVLNLFIDQATNHEVEVVYAFKQLIQEKELHINFSQSIYNILYENGLVKLPVLMLLLNKNEFDTLIKSQTSKAIKIEPSSSIKRVIEEDEETTAKKPKLSVKEPEASCPICLETLSELKKNKMGLMSAPCGHIMCKECATIYFKLKEKKSRQLKSLDCPVCRKKVVVAAVHDIYI